MKKILIIPMLCLSLFLTAQDILQTQTIVENTLKELKAGMALADFKEKKPSAEAIKDMDFRVTMLEKINQNGLKVIAYYFDNDGKKPFYETLIAFDNEAICKETAQKLFGAPNHPTKKDKNIWVIYKGDDDITTTAWTYKERLILYSQVPKSEMENDEMFNLPDDFKNVDLRPNSEQKKTTENEEKSVENEEVKPDETKKKEVAPENDGTSTVEDYARELSNVFDEKFKLKMSSDTLIELFPTVKLDKNSLDFRNEYSLPINKSGLKHANFYGIKNGNKAIYEVILEFANADTLMRLAELMFPNLNHPSLENHWILNIEPKSDNGSNLVSMAWVYENKMILAVNLPNSELEKEGSFQLADDFIEAYLKQLNPNKTDEENTDNSDNEATSLTVNKLIAAAAKDFEDNKTDLMPNKKEEYDASAFVTLGQEQAVIRKNAAGNWRLEVRFPVYSDAETAKGSFEKTIAFYQSLEGLEYRLVKKSDLTTANGRTYIWDIQTLDDAATGLVLKWQTYPTSNGQFGIKMELGK
jgi:hypothetical protein